MVWLKYKRKKILYSQVYQFLSNYKKINQGKFIKKLAISSNFFILFHNLKIYLY